MTGAFTEPADDATAETVGVGAAVGAAVCNVEPWGTTVELKPGMVDTPVGIAGTAVARGSRIGDGTSDGAIDIVGEASADLASACHIGAGAEEARERVFAGTRVAIEPHRLGPCCWMDPLGDGRDLAGEPQGGTAGTLPPKLLQVLLVPKPAGTSRGGHAVS